MSLLTASIFTIKNFQQKISSYFGSTNLKHSAKYEAAFIRSLFFRKFTPVSLTISRQFINIEVVFSVFSPYCFAKASILFLIFSISGWFLISGKLSFSLTFRKCLIFTYSVWLIELAISPASSNSITMLERIFMGKDDLIVCDILNQSNGLFMP